MTRSRAAEQDYESEEEDQNAEPFQYEESDQDYKYKDDNPSLEITPDAYLNKAKR